MIAEKDLFGIEVSMGGNISRRCNVTKDKETTYILIDGTIIYHYEKSDKVSMRMAWSEIYLKGFVTYKEAAKGAGVTNTTVKNWVSSFRENGYIGLFDKDGRGLKGKLSDDDKKKIFALREERLSTYEIARKFGCSHVAIWKVLQSKKANVESSLDLIFEDEIAEKEIVEEVEEVEVEEVEVEEVEAEMIEEESIEEKEVELVVEKESVENAGEKAKPVGIQMVGDTYISTLLDDKLEARMAKNRDSDRSLAVTGKLFDAIPYFAPNKHLEYAGIFMAFVVLAQGSFLSLGVNIFKHIGPAFYGLRTTLLSFITLALLRIKRPEHLLEKNPEKLGVILGLDRIFSARTYRRKIAKMSKVKETMEYMKALGNARAKEFDGEVNTVMVDGHTIGYFGKKKVGSTWSARDNKVLNAHTENWVNLPGNAPLFSLETSFNNGLTSSLEEVLSQTKEILETEELTCVFDRGGSSGALFERLTEKNFGIITYQKGNYDDIDEGKFKKGNITLGVRKYSYLPFEQDVEIKIYEKIDKGENKRSGCKDTKRTVKMRDIRVLCNDGHQVSILANYHVKKTTKEVADIMFQRIGSQENVFKYMRREFDVDGLVSYDFVDVDDIVEHPNPKWIKQEKKIAKLKKEQKTLLAKLSDSLFLEESKSIQQIIEKFSENDALSLLKKIQESKQKLNKKEAIQLFDGLAITKKMKTLFALQIFNTIKKSNIQTREELAKILQEIISPKKLTPQEAFKFLENVKTDNKMNAILKLNDEIIKEKNVLHKMPYVENAKQAGYKKPKPEPKRLMNIVKIAAYTIETKLFDMLAKHYKYNKNEGRKLIKSAMASTGSLKLKPGELVIQLEPQANPRRTRAINELLKDLNAMKSKFPGSQRIIKFQLTPIKK